VRVVVCVVWFVGGVGGGGGGGGGRGGEERERGGGGGGGGGGRSLEKHAGRIMGYIDIEIDCPGINLVAVDVDICALKQVHGT